MALIDNRQKIVESHTDVGKGEQGQFVIAVGQSIPHEITEKIDIWQEGCRGQSGLFNAFGFECHGLTELMSTFEESARIALAAFRSSDEFPQFLIHV